MATGAKRGRKLKLYGGLGSQVRDIMLTFDDGPNPATTPHLLDILAAGGIPAIFFVRGDAADTPEGRSIVARAFSEGHLIGNHTFSHPNLVTLTPPQIKDEIDRCHNIIGHITGQVCRVFRPPYGTTNRIVGEILIHLDYAQLLWTSDSRDYAPSYQTNGRWVGRAIQETRSLESSILLLHDTFQSTIQYFPAYVSQMQQLGSYRYVRY